MKGHALIIMYLYVLLICNVIAMKQCKCAKKEYCYVQINGLVCVLTGMLVLPVRKPRALALFRWNCLR